jgi:hypothetical protein
VSSTYPSRLVSRRGAAFSLAAFGAPQPPHHIRQQCLPASYRSKGLRVRGGITRRFWLRPVWPSFQFGRTLESVWIAFGD